VVTLKRFTKRYKIVNESKNITISDSAELARSFFSRFLGLMFSKERRDIILKFEKDSIFGSSIHMFFVFYEIDVIWVNSKLKVVDIRRKIKPFNPIDLSTYKLYLPKRAAKYVIELGKSSCKNVEIGDKIRLIPI